MAFKRFPSNADFSSDISSSPKKRRLNSQGEYKDAVIKNADEPKFNFGDDDDDIDGWDECEIMGTQVLSQMPPDTTPKPAAHNPGVAFSQAANAFPTRSNATSAFNPSISTSRPNYAAPQQNNYNRNKPPAAKFPYESKPQVNKTANIRPLTIQGTSRVAQPASRPPLRPTDAEFKKLKSDLEEQKKTLLTKEGEVTNMRMQNKKLDAMITRDKVKHIREVEEVKKQSTKEAEAAKAQLDKVRTEMQFKDHEIKSLTEKYQKLQAASEGKLNQSQVVPTKKNLKVKNLIFLTVQCFLITSNQKFVSRTKELSSHLVISHM